MVLMHASIHFPRRKEAAKRHKTSSTRDNILRTSAHVHFPVTKLCGKEDDGDGKT